MVVRNKTPEVLTKGKKRKSNSVCLRKATIISSNSSAETATVKNGNSRLIRYEYILNYPQLIDDLLRLAYFKLAAIVFCKFTMNLTACSFILIGVVYIFT